MAQTFSAYDGITRRSSRRPAQHACGVSLCHRLNGRLNAAAAIHDCARWLRRARDIPGGLIGPDAVRLLLRARFEKMSAHDAGPPLRVQDTGNQCAGVTYGRGVSDHDPSSSSRSATLAGMVMAA